MNRVLGDLDPERRLRPAPHTPKSSVPIPCPRTEYLVQSSPQRVFGTQTTEEVRTQKDRRGPRSGAEGQGQGVETKPSQERTDKPGPLGRNGVIKRGMI